jgi:hypothetical protein
MNSFPNEGKLWIVLEARAKNAALAVTRSTGLELSQIDFKPMFGEIAGF